MLREIPKALTQETRLRRCAGSLCSRNDLVETPIGSPRPHVRQRERVQQAEKSPAIDFWI